MATVEEQLDNLRAQILYARKKAESYRKRAAAQDAIADAKVKECAGLQTMELFPARERMRKAIANCDERAYEKAQADLEKEHHPM